MSDCLSIRLPKPSLSGFKNQWKIHTKSTWPPKASPKGSKTLLWSPKSVFKTRLGSSWTDLGSILDHLGSFWDRFRTDFRSQDLSRRSKLAFHRQQFTIHKRALPPTIQLLDFHKLREANATNELTWRYQLKYWLELPSISFNVTIHNPRIRTYCNFQCGLSSSQ